MRNGMLWGFVISVGIITYDTAVNCKDLPWPPQIVATGLVFAILDLVSFFAQELSNVMAIGFVLALIVTNVMKNAPCNHQQGTAQPASYQTLGGGSQPSGQIY